MMTTPRPPQPAVMTLIEQRRKRLGLSYRRAAKLAGISESRWRQLKDGGRIIRDIAIPEEATDHVLARMAGAVRLTPGELRGAGHPGAAVVLDDLLADQASQDAEDARDAARMVALIQGRGFPARTRSRLETEIAIALQRARTESDLTSR